LSVTLGPYTVAANPPSRLADTTASWRYQEGVIRSFRCRDTSALAQGQRVKHVQAFEAIARRKLRQLEIAATLDD
jgi:hypothetical protein